MAYVDDNLFTEGGRGAIAKKIVLKKINGKTFITKYPDMSDVDYNTTQLNISNCLLKGLSMPRAY